MRRTTMTLGLYLLIIGIVLTAIGLITHAPKTVVWNNGLHVSRQIDQTKTVKDFDSIKVDNGEGQVKIVASNNDNDDKFHVQVIGDDKQVPSYDIKDRTLKIDRKTKYRTSFGESEQIIVTVPKNAKLKKVDLHLGYDSFDLKGFSVDELVTHRTSDDTESRLKLENMKVLNSTNLNVGNYYLTANDSEFKDLTINAKSYDDGDFDDDDNLEDEVKSNSERNTNAHVHLQNTVINNGTFALNAANLAIKNSQLNNVQSKATRGSALLTNSTLTGKNSFDLEHGIFLGTGNNVAGVDLKNNQGKITFAGNSTTNHSYQDNQNADNLLKVTGDRVTILIR